MPCSPAAPVKPNAVVLVVCCCEALGKSTLSVSGQHLGMQQFCRIAAPGAKRMLLLLASGSGPCTAHHLPHPLSVPGNPRHRYSLVIGSNNDVDGSTGSPDVAGGDAVGPGMVQPPRTEAVHPHFSFDFR